jgi:D-xylose transport system permease protein
MTSIDLARGRPVRWGLERVSQVVGIDARLLGMVLVLIAIWLVLNLMTGGAFLSARNLFNLSLQVAVVGVMATGMVLVIVSRNIDLSIGSVLGFVGVFGALAQTEYLGLEHGYTWWVTSLLMLLVGTAIGAGQGAIIAYGGVPSFVVTLGGLLFFRNAAFQINLGATVAPLDQTFQLLGGGLNGTIGAFWSWMCGGLAVLLIAASAITIRRKRQRFGFPVRPPLMEAITVGLWSALVLAFVGVMNSYLQPKTGVPMGIAIPVLILIGVTLVMTVIARRTAFGRYVYAIGGNPESAELAGISVKRTIMEVFALMGFLSGVASIIVTARLNAGASVTGTMTELSVIAAAVIGGTSLAGGIGTIYGAILGAVFMQSLENGMVLLGVPTPLQRMVIAVVLVAAVWIDRIYQRSRR